MIGNLCFKVDKFLGVMFFCFVLSACCYSNLTVSDDVTLKAAEEISQQR